MPEDERTIESPDLSESDYAQLIFAVSGWGERFTLEFKCELEFGLEGYSEILTEELRALENMIENQGIGKRGEQHVRLILPPPIVTRIDEHAAGGSPPLKKPQWRLRYASETDQGCENVWRELRFVREWRRASWIPMWSRIKKKARAVRRLLSRLASFRQIWSLVRVKWLTAQRLRRLVGGRLKRGADLPLAEVSNSFPLGRLTEILKATKRLLCVSERFWRNYGRLVMEVLPPGSWEILSESKTAIDLGDAVRVPLRRYEAGSFEAWARYYAIDCLPEILLVIDGSNLERTVEALQETLLSQQQVILVSEDLPDEATKCWERCTPIGDALWLLQAPLGSLLRAHRFAQPGDGWPKISVVTVSYNQAPYIRFCLDSVLDQGYPNLEYIVVDGGSTDGTREILECYRARLSLLVMEPDKGQSDALNKGFRAATGDVMTWICSDDLLELDSLFHVGRTFACHEIDLVTGGCRIIDDEGRLIDNHHNGLPFGRPVALSFGDLLSFLGVWQRGMFFYQPEVFFSRKIWEASGGYVKEHLHFVMDYDLFLRMAMAGAEILHIPHYIGVSRRQRAQKTQHTDMLYLPTVRALLQEYRGLIEKTRDVMQGNCSK